MTAKLRLVLALHNHQPIGNFDGVMEQAYLDSYRPFLDLFDDYPGLKISLHTSGSLMEWLDERHPEYVDRLGELVRAGRVEIIGGAFYEAILAMIPARDRVGQIASYRQWLETRLGAKVRGMWVPERVWETGFVSDLVRAGVEYTLLDDFHFRNAGLTDAELHGYYVTEDEGKTLAVFPGSERLRYLIPFGQPHETIDYLRWIAGEHPGAVVVFGDDGEKFGTWPETHRHCYVDGWLRRFFDALTENRDWLDVTTLAESVDHVPPLGKVYLPDSSYREMTEWALPAEQIVRYEHVRHEMEHDPRWPVLSQFVRGGNWRNFKVKYPEANEMYSRMMLVSQQLAETAAQHGESPLVEKARRELYRGQCNCGYWHGAFGGIYLPHLRNAVYHHLLKAEDLLHRAAGRQASWIDASAGDWNLDLRQEVLLANDRLAAFFAPVHGGQLYEHDVRAIGHNLLATLARRPEAYHKKVLAGASQQDDSAASIHDRVVFKQAGLDQRVQYDDHLRKSLIDHCYDADASLATIRAGSAPERGDFVCGAYQASLRRGRTRVQVQLARAGNVWGQPLKITKTCTLSAGSAGLEVHYQLEGLPRERTFRFAVEWNFAGLPSGADDRFFHDAAGRRLGQLGQSLDLTDTLCLGLTDEWLGIDVRLGLSRPSGLWAFPIESVSQSEGGFELVHQSVVVMPHWLVVPDAQGCWKVTMKVEADTTQAVSRRGTKELAAAEAR